MQKLFDILYLVIAAFTAITIHEYIKALVSSKLGDPLPKARGRLTLNPLNHFEPVGFLCMVLTGYGWGKPVETSGVYYKDRKKGTILTYVTPPVTNLLIGTALACACRLLRSYIASKDPSALMFASAGSADAALMALYAAYDLLSAIASANVALAFFNIIPVYPLDGAKILALMLPPNQQVKMAYYEKIFQIILLIAVFTGWARMILYPLQSVFLR